jgi:toxin CcdB
MAQFDVHRFGTGLVVDCQSNLLSHITSRFVVPLIRQSEAPNVVRRLNPVFEIHGESYVMVTESAGAVRAQGLGIFVLSLAHRSFEITDAIDILISGV